MATTLTEPTALTIWLVALGWWGPLILCILVALEVLIAPVPGWALALAAGYLYGIWAGTLITWSGAMIGSALAFWLARTYGRHRLIPYIPEHIRQRFDHISRDNGFLILLVARAVPFTALDVLSYAAGFSHMSFRSFIAASALGFLPGTLALVAAGEKAANMSRLNLLLYAALGVYVLWRLVIYWRKQRTIRRKSEQ